MHNIHSYMIVEDFICVPHEVALHVRRKPHVPHKPKSAPPHLQQTLQYRQAR